MSENPPAALGKPPARPANPLISIVLPCRNEEDSIGLFREIAVPTLQAELDDVRLEFVVVDDGSADRTREIALDWVRSDPRVSFVGFSRNFGKEAALTAGLHRATGDAVVPMDIDLQDPPEVVAEFVARWRDGYDTVLGIRRERASDTTTKRVTAHLFYDLFNTLSNYKIKKDAGDFRLIDRRVVNAILELKEKNRFMKGIFAWVGFNTASVYYDRRPRARGRSQFKTARLVAFAIDGIASFSVAPLRIWAFVGLLISFIAALYAIWVLVAALVWGNPVAGYPSLMIVLLISTALNMFTAGVMGEYVGRIFDEVKNRPLYIEDIYVAARGGEAG